MKWFKKMCRWCCRWGVSIDTQSAESAAGAEALADAQVTIDDHEQRIEALERELFIVARTPGTQYFGPERRGFPRTP